MAPVKPAAFERLHAGHDMRDGALMDCSWVQHVYLLSALGRRKCRNSGTTPVTSCRRTT